MIISVASGKGGTGKTTVALNLALTLENTQLMDCDVEEPNIHLFLPFEKEQSISVSIPVPRVDEAKCTYCGQCARVCRFNAIAVIKEQILIFPELCHGCGGCTLFCPAGVIQEFPREIGVVETGNFSGISFIQGILNVGEAMPTPVIRKEKELVDRKRTVIIDCSPGTSCPVIGGVKGSDFCLLVTENTPFGLNDLQLAVEMVRALHIPMGVFINQANLGDGGVREYCSRENISVVGELLHERRIAEIYSRGGLLVKELPEYQTLFFSLFRNIQQVIGSRN
ncbi:MAG: ATP-binding protein [Deltaproteobacteria bacterium]|nr:ATP-binding protein [Deltaproteobacteria bacterium]